jgi:hypothetical protein
MRKFSALAAFLLIFTASTAVAQEKTDSIAKDNGFYNVSTLGLLFGQGLNDWFPKPSFTTINGYRLNQKYHIGVGTGIEYFEYITIPLFGEVRYELPTTGGSRPFFSVKTGYSFALQNPNESGKTHKGGFLLSPEIGCRYSVNQKATIVISLGYNYQHLSYKEARNPSWSETVQESTILTHYNRISLRIGVMLR